MYVLNVHKNDLPFFEAEYHDFAMALQACKVYYKPKYEHGTLKFTVELSENKLIAYARLTRIADVPKTDSILYAAAAKQDQTFHYNASYLFIINQK